MDDALLRLLERMGAKLPALEDASGGQGEASDRELLPSRLFPLHDRALQATDDALKVLHVASAAAAQQRTALDAATDHLRLVENRWRDANTASTRARDALERVRLLALNAGLEGLRSGDPLSKSLVALAEELRALVHRGVEALDEYGGAAEQLASERNKLRDELDRAARHTATLSDEMLRAQGAQQETRRALEEIEAVLHANSCVDREVAKQVGHASAHAQHLAEALDRLLGTAEGRALASRALAPTLEALGAVSAALRSEHGRKP